jgi:hypothetical protein
MRQIVGIGRNGPTDQIRRGRGWQHGAGVGLSHLASFLPSADGAIAYTDV